MSPYDVEIMPGGEVAIEGETPGDDRNYTFSAWLSFKDIERIYLAAKDLSDASVTQKAQESA